MEKIECNNQQSRTDVPSMKRCSKEQAIALRDLGYRQIGQWYYFEDSDEIRNSNSHLDYNNTQAWSGVKYVQCYAAPLIYEIIGWLDISKGVYVDVRVKTKPDKLAKFQPQFTTMNEFGNYVWYSVKNESVGRLLRYSSRSEAYSAGLTAALNHLKNQKDGN